MLPKPAEWTVRTRILMLMLAFMAAGLTIAGVITFRVEFDALDQRVRAELHQELDEINAYADNQEQLGREYSSADTLLHDVVGHTVPNRHEAVIALADGSPRYQPQVQEYTLDDPAALSELNARSQPGASVITPMSLEDRDLLVLIVSVHVDGDPTQGTLVVANDIGAQRAQIWRSITTYLIVSAAALAITAFVGWRLSGRLLRPISQLRRTAESIDFDDLDARVPVPADQRDDIGALAVRFNQMLDRIQSGYHDQRQFMQDVSHELRTPLTIIRGTLEMTDESDPKDVAQSRVIATDELDRMNLLVEDLSTLAHVRRPDFVQPRPMDLADLADTVFARIQQLGERDWVRGPVAHVTAELDEQRVAQALVQLAANAVRYSPKGSRVDVGFDQRERADGPVVELWVQDEGPGIPKADQQRIFQRFTRLDQTAHTPGSGLGLSIVMAIAKEHGGTVLVDSEPGKGARFTLRLPQYTRSDLG